MDWFEAIKQAAQGVKVRRVDWDESFYIFFDIVADSSSGVLLTEGRLDYTLHLLDLTARWEIYEEKPQNCPWCNSKAEVGTMPHTGTLYRAVCCTEQNCFAKGPICSTSAEAVTKWNRYSCHTYEEI